MTHILEKTLLALLCAALAGCAGAPEDSVKIQPYFLEDVPPGRSVGVMQVLVRSADRKRKSQSLTERTIEELRRSKLFARVGPADRRNAAGFDAVLEASVWDAELPPRETPAPWANLLTLWLYTLAGGETGRYQVRVAHTIKVWAGARKLAEHQVVNLHSAPLSLYREAADHRASLSALQLSPRILLERTALAVKQLPR